MKYTIQMCICDRCKKEVQLSGGAPLPAGWSLISSTVGRERTSQSQNYPSADSTNYATVCDACHAALFGDFWTMQMSTNGGPEYVLR